MGPARTRSGAEPKIAAWIYFSKQVGDTFITPELRAAIGEPDCPNTDEHTYRGFRKLCSWDWDVPSNGTGAGLDWA